MPAAERYLEYVAATSDPVLRTLLTAPQDDEPITPDEEEAAREALEDIEAGRVYTDDRVKKDSGSELDEYTARTRKDLKKLEQQNRKRVVARIDDLAKTGEGDVTRIGSLRSGGSGAAHGGSGSRSDPGAGHPECCTCEGVIRPTDST